MEELQAQLRELEMQKQVIQEKMNNLATAKMYDLDALEKKLLAIKFRPAETLYLASGLGMTTFEPGVTPPSILPADKFTESSSK